MKIEIDLNDILGGETGSETLQESIRRQAIEAITENTKKGISSRIDRAVAETIQEEINTYLKAEMPRLLADIMDAEFRPVSPYGERGETTTFRKAVVKAINENMTCRKTQYASETSAFTKAVDGVIADRVAAFSKQVDAGFTAEAMAYAVNTLKQKLGIK